MSDIAEMRALLYKLRADPDASKVLPMKRTPNPGSVEAIALNCSCPVLDNNHGAGVGKTTWTPESGFGDLFWVNAECPIHAAKHDTEFRVDGIAHRVGDPQCPECYGEWPKPCTCGGLVHREQCSDVDDDWVENFDILRCDKCDDLRI